MQFVQHCGKLFFCIFSISIYLHLCKECLTVMKFETLFLLLTKCQCFDVWITLL